MIIFISCTKTKQNYSCRAKEMYSPSDLFKGAYKYDLSLKPDAIYILSAKYGLLNPNDVINPYEKTLVSAKQDEVKRWSVMVAKQIQQHHIDREQKAVFLCGKPYRKYIQNLFPNHVAPCAHMGIGQQIKFYKENTK